MTKLTLVATRTTDGKRIEAEWDPTTETPRQALERAGFSRLAVITDLHIDPCKVCHSIRIFADGSCADCLARPKAP